MEKGPQCVDIRILTYDDIDGAGAAAMALLAYPTATVEATSAYKINNTLRDILDAGEIPSAIHVCGVGDYQSPQELQQIFCEFRSAGCDITWYSGRGYLKKLKPHLKGYCSLAFHDRLGTNTAAVCRALGVGDDPRAPVIQAVVGKPARKEAVEIGELRDLIEASISRYFRFQDCEAYPRAIGKLAGLEPLSSEDEEAIRAHRTSSFRMALDGRTKQIKAVRKQLGMVAEHERANVLLLGETGTGKEVAARILHEGSRRREKPFCAVNCASLGGQSSDMLNSRLFGHVKGAFTGANKTRPGIFEVADKGTLFLDEVGELPLDTQARLLRVLQSGSLTRVGDDANELHVDVRLIAATNRDLAAAMQSGEFRQDLFYRLNTICIHMPPLRARFKDIPHLVRDLHKAICERHNKEFPAIPKEQLTYLEDYDWPGNIRQLRTILERACLRKMTDKLPELLEEERLFHEGTRAEPSLGDESPPPLLPRSTGAVMTFEELERLYARHVLALMGGNKTHAAKALGISLNTLKSRLG